MKKILFALFSLLMFSSAFAGDLCQQFNGKWTGTWQDRSKYLMPTDSTMTATTRISKGNNQSYMTATLSVYNSKKIYFVGSCVNSSLFLNGYSVYGNVASIHLSGELTVNHGQANVRLIDNRASITYPYEGTFPLRITVTLHKKIPTKAKPRSGKGIAFAFN